MRANLQTAVHHGETLTPRAYSLRTGASVGPGLAWLGALFLGPLALIALISLLSRGEYGTVGGAWTFENYRRLAGFGLLGFDSLYPLIIARSVLLGLTTAMLCLSAGLPLAFFIASCKGRYKNLALTLVVVPLWTNLLIRTYAWQMLLGPESSLTQVAALFGLAEADEGLYPGLFAVSLCMVCDFLPFAVLPIYASVEKLNWSLVEAAMDLGANRVSAFRHGIVPQIKPGLTAGFILVFLPAMGQFVIPDLLGGAKTMLLGNAIQQQFGAASDWPFGSAVAMVSLLVAMLALWLMARHTGDDELNIL